MIIKKIPMYHVIIKEESSEYRFYIYTDDQVFYKSDSLYSDRYTAVIKGQFWLRQQYELDRLPLYGD